jgi:hypothetical protein
MIARIPQWFVFCIRGSILLLLVASISIMCNSDALAQAQQQSAPAQVASSKLPPVKQIALTEKQIKGVAAASKESAPSQITRQRTSTS